MSERRAMYRSKGTITVFLSLVSVLLLSLFCTIAESARVQAARFQAAAAFDMGLFSVFGEYDRVLLEEYDLWFLDCSDESGRKLQEVLETKLENYIVPNICPKNNIRAGWTFDVFPTEITGCTVDKYALATDQGGQVFYTQAVQNQKELFAGEAALALKNKIKDIEKGEEKGREYEKEEANADEAYRKAQAEQKAADQKAEEEKAEQEKDAQGEQKESEVTAIPEEKKADNVLDQVEKVRKMGILSLVMKDPSRVSNKKIARRNLPSERTLKKGNLRVSGSGSEIASKAIFMKYLGDYFKCAVEKQNTTGKGSKKHALSYELEYIIGGKKSDAENLKTVVRKILLLREGVNYMYIAGNAKMQSETWTLAATIAGAAAVPAFTSAIQVLLMLAWAYGESLMDARILLAGGKVPAVKTAADWKLSLSQLGNLTEVLKQCDKEKGRGQSYHDYLIGIAALTGKTKTSMRALDLIEENRRMEKGGEDFCVDALASQAKAEAEYELMPVFLKVPAVWMKIRNQGTSYKISGQYGYMEGGV